MATVKERLKQYIDFKGISVRSFESTCGLSYGYVGNMRQSIQPDKIMKIAHYFPDLNTGWLLTGEGKMLNGPYERINQILEKGGLTQRDFAKGTGGIAFIFPSIFQKAQKNPGDPVVLEEWIDALLERFPQYSREWILTGEGEMLEADRKVVKGYSNDGVPYYAVDFLAGFDLVVNDQTRNPDGYVSFPNIRGAQCWVDISGKSMSPLIDPGDVIAIKKLEDWPVNILYGEVYALVTEQYRTVKRVRRSEQEGYIRLVPENRDFDPQDIPISSVVAIYQVLGCAKKLF